MICKVPSNPNHSMIPLPTNTAAIPAHLSPGRDLLPTASKGKHVLFWLLPHTR